MENRAGSFFIWNSKSTTASRLAYFLEPPHQNSKDSIGNPAMNAKNSGIDQSRVKQLKDREDLRFQNEHPRSIALRKRGLAVMPNGVPMAWHRGSYHHEPPWALHASGARFTDVDGHTYS